MKNSKTLIAVLTAGKIFLIGSLLTGLYFLIQYCSEEGTTSAEGFSAAKLFLVVTIMITYVLVEFVACLNIMNSDEESDLKPEDYEF